MTARGAPSDPPAAPDLVAGPAVEPSGTAPAAAAEIDPLVGEVLGGRYRLLERLAVGGMGTVYRAQHVGLQTEVAIKLVNDGPSARSDHALRFLREAMLTSRIDHPNVVSATDYGTFEDGTAYLAMSLVNGPTLASVLQSESPMGWARAAELGAQIADAVAAAQAQGIVHRDLKPDNLVLQPMPGGGDAVKVLDFGIAKYARDSLAPPPVQRAQQATRVGMVVGTPGYMAPEQAVGMRADHRADLYSIGVILWECVVARRLWAFDGDMQRLLSAQLNRRPPSVRSASGDDTIPAAFEEIVASLLATRPEDRPGSAIEVRDALRTVIRTTQGQRAQAPAAPPVRLVVSSPLAAADTRAVAVVAFRKRGAVQDGPAPEAPSEPPAEAPSEPAAAPAAPAAEAYVPPALPMRRAGRRWLVGALGLASVGALIGLSAQAPPAPPLAARRPRPVPIGPAAAAPPSAEVAPLAPTLPAEPSASPSPSADAVHQELPTGALNAAIKVRPRALPFTAPSAPPSGETADQLRARARSDFTSGGFRSAAASYRLATKKAPRHAGAHAGLGASLLALGEAKGAIEAYRRAIQLEPGSSGFHAALGRAYLVSGDRARAVDAYRKAVALDPANQTAFAALAQLAP